MEMVHFMALKLMSNCLMFLVENINAVLFNQISNFHKDLIYNLEEVNNNNNKNKLIKIVIISIKRNNKRKNKLNNRYQNKLNNKKVEERKDKKFKLLLKKEKD